MGETESLSSSVLEFCVERQSLRFAVGLEPETHLLVGSEVDQAASTKCWNVVRLAFCLSSLWRRVVV